MNKENKKIIFLDIDGVLNQFNNDVVNQGINPLLSDRLLSLINNTNADIIITSDWRFNPKELEKAWNETNLPNYIGMTKEQIADIKDYYGTDFERNRVIEIKNYIEDNYKDEDINYIILDDMNLDYDKRSDKIDYDREFLNHFIKINPNTGITNLNIKKAIQLLKK